MALEEENLESDRVVCRVCGRNEGLPRIQHRLFDSKVDHVCTTCLNVLESEVLEKEENGSCNQT